MQCMRFSSLLDLFILGLPFINLNKHIIVIVVNSLGLHTGDIRHLGKHRVIVTYVMTLCHL